MSNKKSFMLYLDTLEVFYDLSPEEAKELIIAIIDFQKGKEITCSRTISLVFKSFQSQFVRDNEKYEAILKRNRENGSNGGRPPKNSEEQTQNNPNNPVGFLETEVNPNNPSEPKKPDSDNDSVNDSENGKEKRKRKKVDSEVETSVHSQIKNLFIDFYKRKTKLDYYWKSQDGKKTNSIITQLEFSIKKANPNFNKDNEPNKIVDAFKFLLTGVELTPFYHDKLSTSVIDSKYSEFALKAKAHHSSLLTGKTGVNKYVNKNPAFFYSTQYLTAEEYERYENKNYLVLQEKDVTPPSGYVKPHGI